MKSLYNIIRVIVVSAIVFTSCEAFEEVSDVPEISFKSYTPYLADTLDLTVQAGELVFDFQDGNADFGADTIVRPDLKVNLWLIPFQKLNGVYDSIDAETYGRKYTITQHERLDRSGQNKTIRGEVKVQIYYFLPPPYDTIKYEFFIVDRYGNKSNVESTTDITF